MIKKLDRKASILLIVGMLYLAGMTLAATFVNVFLIRLTNDLGLIILQNIMNYASLLGAFLLGTYLVKKISINNLFRAGIISTIVYYLLILVLKDDASKYLIFLGMFMGVGSGLYYFSFNILVGKLVGEEERASFFSYQTTFSYIFGVIAPTLSGFIIVHFTELTGYYLLFGCAVLLFITAIIILTQLKNIKVETEYHVLEALKTKSKYWTTNLYCNFTFGLREAIYSQIFVVFTYSIINNEQVIGNLNSLLYFVGVFSAMLIASKFNLRNIKKYQLIGGVIYFTAMMLMATLPSFIQLIITYSLLGLVICWNIVIFQTLKYKLASFITGNVTQSDVIIACEFPMAVGRIFGLVVSLLLVHTVGGDLVYRILFALLSIMVLFDYFIIKKKINWLED